MSAASVGRLQLEPSGGFSTPRASHVAGGEVVLNVEEDAKLREVLHQLNREYEHGRAYDPHKFTMERMDDGIQQRLDLDMQVKQLPGQVNVLTVVRMDAPLSPMTRMPSLNHLASMTKGGKKKDTSKYTSSGRTRPPREIFCFNDYAASIAREYDVTVSMAARSSKHTSSRYESSTGRYESSTRRARPCECHLLVDREQLYHQPPRGSQPLDETNPKKTSATLNFMKKIVPWVSIEPSRAEPSIFVARRICDVQSISYDEQDQHGFSIVYGTTEEGVVSRLELFYQAESPTKCAELVAFVEYLMTLAA